MDPEKCSDVSSTPSTARTSSPLLPPPRTNVRESPLNPPGWREYPLNLAGYDAVVTNGEAYSERLESLSDTLFSDDVLVRVVDAPDRLNSETVKLSFRDQNSIEKYISGTASPRFRLISIAQDHSLTPFSINENLMRKILSHHAVPPKFLELLFGFGDKARSSEEGSGYGIQSSLSANNQDICYQLRYVENNNRAHGNPWSLRQTGVYHRYSKSEQAEHFWLLLHPKQNSRGQLRFETAASSETGNGNLSSNPIRLHLSIMSSYLDSWRWYLHDLGRSYLETENMVLATDIEDRADYTMTFNTLQSLRHLEEKLIPLSAIFRSTISTIHSLEDMNHSFLEAHPEHEKQLAETADQLAMYSSRLEGHLASAEIMQKRVRSVIKLVADGLNLRNQATAAGINHHLLTLTRDTVDDSATVRVVTLVTLIYLPASFLAALFGMDFFSFNQTTFHFEVSSDFWMYFVATVPLTLLTIGYWQYRARQQKKRREARRRLAGQVQHIV